MAWDELPRALREAHAAQNCTLAANLYLRKTFDPATQALGEKFTLDADEFSAHGLVVGMGSGRGLPSSNV